MTIPDQKIGEEVLRERLPRRPDWLKVKFSASEEYREVRKLVSQNALHTVCESARCPNIGECWGQRTATFMILGDICTRSCGFCAITTGRPIGLDRLEPQRVANAVKKLDLRHAVITSVNRDELKDGGSSIFAATILAIRKTVPNCRIEVLIPDFKGCKKSLKTVLDAKPDILNHNTETISRLYRIVRPQAHYRQSLEVIKYSKKFGAITKSGIMVGIGERFEEVLQVISDLKEADCDIMTIGQYLQPTRRHLPVDRYVTPEEFKKYKDFGMQLGFRHVESGPLVRSSYHAADHVN
ncbi:lipoyl synthase [candidate division KSB1 bacterium]|nr:lipoyl synthase [candidate division KSB1 bacterium]